MAADASMLGRLTGGRTAAPCVRVYEWDRPSVSIGRLQSEDEVCAHYPGLPIVRRPTGGRAVRHGDDLTVTVAVPLERLPAECRSVTLSHRLILGPLEAALRSIGREVCFGGCPIHSQRTVVDCFDLAASCDLIDSHTGAKLVGSAQRRQEQAILQQMSVPFRVIGADKAAFLVRIRQEFDRLFRSCS